MVGTMIKKIDGKYCVISHKTGKNMGSYDTEDEAKKRLAQIKRFSEKTIKSYIDEITTTANVATYDKPFAINVKPDDGKKKRRLKFLPGYLGQRPHGSVPSSKISNRDTIDYNDIDMSKIYDNLDAYIYNKLKLRELFVGASEGGRPDTPSDKKRRQKIVRELDKVSEHIKSNNYILELQAHFSDIHYTDRYDALGIPQPDIKTMCKGQCEGTGIIPVYMHIGDANCHSDSTARCPNETDPKLIAAWNKCEEEEPCDDGWHFVKCPDCNGTGKCNNDYSSTVSIDNKTSNPGLMKI